MCIHSKSRSWKSVGAVLDGDVADAAALLPEVVFKRVVLLPVLLSALGNDDLEPFGVLLLQFSPVSVELDDETSTRGGIGLFWPPLVDSPLMLMEVGVAWENVFDWLGLVVEELDDDGKLNEN